MDFDMPPVEERSEPMETARGTTPMQVKVLGCVSGVHDFEVTGT